VQVAAVRGKRGQHAGPRPQPEIEIGKDQFAPLEILVEIDKQAVVPVQGFSPALGFGVNDITVRMGFVM
jgi:hypothetical protein